MSIKNSKKWWPIFAKVLVTLSLIGLVYSQINLDNVSEKLSSVDIEFLLYACMCHLLAYAFYAIRYIYILKILNPVKKISILAKWYYFGLFCNNYLPTSVGGDVVRIYALRKENYSLEKLIVSSFADRLIGFASIFATGLVAVALSPLLISLDSRFTILIPVIIILAFFAGTVFLKISSTLKPRESSIVYKILGKLKEVAYIFKTYQNKKLDILAAFLISLCAQLFIIFSYALLGKGLDLDLDLITYFAVVSIVFLASAMPVSVGGLGIREGTLVALLSLYSVDYNDAAALSLMYLFLITVITLPALVIPLQNNRKTGDQISTETEK